jgi:hypothetical protein
VISHADWFIVLGEAARAGFSLASVEFEYFHTGSVHRQLRFVQRIGPSPPCLLLLVSVYLQGVASKTYSNPHLNILRCSLFSSCDHEIRHATNIISSPTIRPCLWSCFAHNRLSRHSTICASPPIIEIWYLLPQLFLAKTQTGLFLFL